jgi:hypothetical protein
MLSKSITSSKRPTVPTVPVKKRSTNRQEYTQKDLENAIAACDPQNPARISMNQAQVLFGVPKTTIRNRLLGGLSNTEAHTNEQALSPEEEAVLATYCKLRGY